MKLIRNTWLWAIGKQTPREVFAELNQELIDLKKEEIKAEPGNNAFGGGLLNAAITRAWDECEDKEKYAEMAEDSCSKVEQSVLSSIRFISCVGLITTRLEHASIYRISCRRQRGISCFGRLSATPR